MINKEFFAALSELEREKGIEVESFIETLELALSSAYKKNNGEATQVVVRINPEKNSIRVYAVKTVVLDVQDPDKEISLSEARLVKKSHKIGDIVQKEIAPKNFGRIAAQTAKQVVLQRLRDVERTHANHEYQEKENQIITCVVHKTDEEQNVYVEVAEGTNGIMTLKDQIVGETYTLNEKIKVFVKKVKQTPKGPQILVSRSHVGFVKKLFELQVPEIKQGVVVIKGISRDAGGRTKIAVESLDAQVDAVGSCVGAKGARVNAVVSELGGEKVDIIEWCENPAEYIARALSPANALMVEVDTESNSAIAVVNDDKLSLAIGKSGQNVRLAARLTGWKIDVKPKSKMLEAENQEDEYDMEDIDENDIENIDETFEDTIEDSEDTQEDVEDSKFAFDDSLVDGEEIEE